MSDLTHLFRTNANGEFCVTQEGLDAIWPPDDREALPLAEVFGKGFNMPPDCGEWTTTEEERMAFAFGAYQPDWPGGGGVDTPAVPVPPSLGLALVAVAAFGLLRARR